MSGKTLLSMFFGVGFALLSCFVLNVFQVPNTLLLSCLAGAITYLIMYPLLTVSEKINAKRYAEYEKQFSAPILYKANCNCTKDKGAVRNGNLYLFADRLVFVSLDQKPLIREEILLAQIRSQQAVHMSFMVSDGDGRTFLFTTPEARKMSALLSQIMKI